MSEANVLLADALRGLVDEADYVSRDFKEFIIKGADRISLNKVTLGAVKSTVNPLKGYEDLTLTFRIQRKD